MLEYRQQGISGWSHGSKGNILRQKFGSVLTRNDSSMRQQVLKKMSSKARNTSNICFMKGKERENG